MCGIAGIINYKEGFRFKENLISASSMMKNRGPDDDGLWNDDVCGFAQRRLSILDLSQAGHQPMLSHNERYVCTFNGEIYNFKIIKNEISKLNLNIKWKGNSDTEVLLEGWKIYGKKLLDKIDGMFAFAIWDRKDKTLFLARDRMGEKPLYYHYKDGKFIFASRPSPLFQLEPQLSKDYDLQGIRYFLESGYVPAPHSIYSSVKKLSAGSYIEIKENKIEIHKYWNPENISTEFSWNKRSENDLLDELDQIISNSVNDRMISDVPLGAFLSGGIDSTLIVAMMNKFSSNKIKTFTIGFNEANYDESIHARKVATHLNTDHHCNHLSVNDLQKLMPKFFSSYDEPFFDSAAFPTLAVSKLAKEHVSVSLTGDGGDELFGGYHYYRIVKILSYFYKAPKTTRKFLSAVFKAMPNHNFQLLSNALNQTNVAESFSFMRGISKDFDSILSNDVIENTVGLSDLFSKTSSSFAKNIDSAEIAMRIDARHTMNDDYLQKTDVASMAYSLESRAPFLSKELIEWSYKLPINYKLGIRSNKYLLRKLSYRYVPKKIMDRPKRGFGVPIDIWLRNDLKSWALDIINDDHNYDGLPIIKKNVKNLFEIHNKGSRNAHPLLWAALTMLQFNKNQNL